MKNVTTLLLITVALSLTGCNEDKLQTIIFGTSPDYPPFEYMYRGKLEGFDIELARLVAAELGKEAQFKEMTFNAVLLSLDSGLIDAGISTFTASEERKQNYDFTNCYYHDNLSMVYNAAHPILNIPAMQGKKISTQLGSTMEVWFKENAGDIQLELFDNNNVAIQALKTSKVDGVLLDSLQAKEFAEKDNSISHSFIAKSNNGYAIAVKKGSPLTSEINKALLNLTKAGKIAELEKKWLE